MFKLYTFFLMFIFTNSLFAIEKEKELIADRPYQTESSRVVPLGSLHIETGIVYSSDNFSVCSCSDAVTNYYAYHFGTTMLRFGLMENLELRLYSDYTIERTKNSREKITNQGYSPISAGSKMQITEESGAIPETAFILMLKTPFGSPAFKPERLEPMFIFSMTNTFPERFNLSYNLGVEWKEGIPSYLFTLNFGIKADRRTSTYLEIFGAAPENMPASFVFDSGLIYLFYDNFQADFSAGAALTEKAYDWFIGTGFTWRLPK